MSFSEIDFTRFHSSVCYTIREILVNQNFMQDLHKVQMKILLELLFRPASRFTDLNIDGLTNDHFTYHIQKLVSDGYVEKVNGKYSLTQTGKEFANRIDEKTSSFVKQAKVGVLYCAIREGKNGKEYLIHERTKEPFRGCHGFGSGKVEFGESLFGAAKRELNEETGLEGEPIYAGVNHYTNEDPQGKLLADRVLFVFKFFEPEGNLIPLGDGVISRWITEEEMANIKNKFPGFDELFKALKSGKEFFREEVFVVEKI